MGHDAVEDYQQLSESLDAAAETLGKAKRRASKKSAQILPNIAPTPEIPTSVSEITAALKSASQNGPELGEIGVVEAGADQSAEHLPDGVVVEEETEKSSGASGAASGAGLVDLNVLEALIFSTRHPLTAGRIGELMDVPSSKALRQAIATLNKQYEETGRTFRIEQVAGGYQMLTLPSFGALLNTLHQREIDSKLSRSALETLSIIAYKQPVLRAEVEAIRGVASGETIRSLMEKHLVKIAGRAEEPGRPILYGTTKRFLEIFGLNSLKELPKGEEARPARPAGVNSSPAKAVTSEPAASIMTEAATETAVKDTPTETSATETSTGNTDTSN